MPMLQDVTHLVLLESLLELIEIMNSSVLIVIKKTDYAVSITIFIFIFIFLVFASITDCA